MTTRPHDAPVPTVYRRLAFTTLHWPGWSFEAAMAHPTRARIIDQCATYYEKKMETIIPISRIEREANAAALQYSDINAACPYPFDTGAGRLFKEFFLLAREISTKTALCEVPTGASSY
ncbi:hypothetical protein [Polaromonas sp. CG_23.6]|uniref:hypothetical protein n=1 Tax=Polaromonas sp. CG_23.6 TaxID=2760709 RepID=UPI00247327E7|nr:hypothetical protein [Polaromonas sp. CG_23.6]MDH6185512.1 hypothetical protein [Polaromonas sp. CG_23.6]